jgi:hypothetical protein
VNSLTIAFVFYRLNAEKADLGGRSKHELLMAPVTFSEQGVSSQIDLEAAAIEAVLPCLRAEIENAPQEINVGNGAVVTFLRCAGYAIVQRGDAIEVKPILADDASFPLGVGVGVVVPHLIPCTRTWQAELQFEDGSSEVLGYSFADPQDTLDFKSIGTTKAKEHHAVLIEGRARRKAEATAFRHEENRLARKEIKEIPKPLPMACFAVTEEEFGTLAGWHGLVALEGIRTKTDLYLTFYEYDKKEIRAELKRAKEAIEKWKITSHMPDEPPVWERWITKPHIVPGVIPPEMKILTIAQSQIEINLEWDREEATAAQKLNLDAEESAVFEKEASL